VPVPPCPALNKAAAVVAATSSSTLLAQMTLVLGLQIYAPQTVQHLPNEVRAEVATVPVVQENLVQRASAEVCEHPPQALVVLRTKKSRGHRARCLECGAVGSQRESAAQAWRALRWLSYRDTHFF
jgi:hypothetical protein